MGLKHYYNKLKSIIGLALSLSKANFKTRNEGSYFGILWYLLYPLSLFLIILFIKNSGLLTSKIPYYPIYLFIGLIANNFFIKTIASSIDVINSNSNLIKSIKTHYESLVLSRVFESVYSHFFEFLLLIVLLIYYQIPLGLLIFYPAVFGIFLLLTTGISFIFATIGVYINDLKNIWMILSQIIFFITPIFYKITFNSIQHKINLFNPLYYFLDITRNLLINQELNVIILLIFSFLGMIIFSFGLFTFIRFKHKFAGAI
ncbi:ABC transporter permease [Candidatus Pacearchaeota archaeon]|nr:ABC transporter permease [Candidatus Pacearchaeota archaeon]